MTARRRDEQTGPAAEWRVAVVGRCGETHMVKLQLYIYINVVNKIKMDSTLNSLKRRGQKSREFNSQQEKVDSNRDTQSLLTI